MEKARAALTIVTHWDTLQRRLEPRSCACRNIPDGPDSNASSKRNDTPILSFVGHFPSSLIF